MDRPILFTPSLAQAVYEGWKSVTRRVVKPQPENVDEPWPSVESHVTFYDMLHEQEWGVPFLTPYGKKGDKLWVKETWKVTAWSKNSREALVCYKDGKRIWRELPWGNAEEANESALWLDNYKDSLLKIKGVSPGTGLVPHEGMTWEDDKIIPWKASLFMPRWVARSTRTVVSVSLQRVQDITEEEAIREGVWTASPGMATFEGQKNHIGAFRKLWDSVVGDKETFGWESNPWVWRIEFEPEVGVEARA